MAAMADTDRRPEDEYRPEMDAETHEKSYEGFVEFTTLSTLVVLCWVLALALGGIKGAWMAAIAYVVISSVAGALGAMSRTITWKAPGAVFVLMILHFLVL
jgi:hypothetical protein